MTYAVEFDLYDVNQHAKYHYGRKIIITGKTSLEVAPTTLTQKTRRTIGNSNSTHIYDTPHLNRHSVVTVCIFQHCAATGFPNFTFTSQSVDRIHVAERRTFSPATEWFDL